LIQRFSGFVRRLAVVVSALSVGTVSAMALGAVAASAGPPVTCTVNSTADAAAAAPATSCDSTLGTGKVTLRSAIERFNSPAGSTTVTFNLPAGSVITLTLGELAVTSISGTLTIIGPGARALAVDGNAASRVFHIGPGRSGTVTAVISGITVRNGKTSLTRYPAYSGGGFFNDRANLTLDQVMVTGNVASWGAAIDQEGVLTLTNSTLSGNSITTSRGRCGGAAMEVEAQGLAVTTTFTNVTVTGNTEEAACRYGTFAIFGKTMFTNVTIASNTGAHGAVSGTGRSLTIKNSILAGHTGSANCVVTPVDGGNNLDSGASCGFTAPQHDQFSTDPLLAPLANNGGETDTMAVGSTSPAIDGVLAAACPPPAADQRGLARPQGASCDIGAFEFSPLKVTTVTVSCGVPAGGGLVTINGSGFLGVTQVQFGRTPALSFTFISDTRIDAVAPSGPAGQAVDITVTTPAGTSTTGAGDACTYQTLAVTAAPTPIPSPSPTPTPTLPKAGAGGGTGNTGGPWLLLLLLGLFVAGLQVCRHKPMWLECLRSMGGDVRFGN